MPLLFQPATVLGTNRIESIIQLYLTYVFGVKCAYVWNQIKLLHSVMLAQLKQDDALSFLNNFLKRVKKSHGDVITTRHYNIILQFCAKAEPGSLPALQTALDTYALLDSSAKDTFQATDQTYSNLMTTIGNQMPETDMRRGALLKGIFKKAVNEGLVSYYVYDALRRTLPHRVYSDILKPAVSRYGGISYNNVPKEWKQRCRP